MEIDEGVKHIGGIEIDEIDETALEEGSSLCDSESAVSITNQNYCGPTAAIPRDVEDDKKGRTAKRGDTKSANKSSVQEVVVVYCNTSYLLSCTGLLRLLHVILSLVALVSLSLCRTESHEDFLLLPLSWHLRIMLFVIVTALLVNSCVWTLNVTGLVLLLPVNWFFVDMVVYGVLSFLYLVGASLIASAFDFYQKMNLQVPNITIQRLIICTVVGYVCMLLHGFTAFIGYRRWQFQHKLFKKRKLIEEEDDYLDI